MRQTFLESVIAGPMLCTVPRTWVQPHGGGGGGGVHAEQDVLGALTEGVGGLGGGRRVPGSVGAVGLCGSLHGLAL